MDGRLHLEHDIKNFSGKKVKHPDHFAVDDPDVFYILLLSVGFYPCRTYFFILAVTFFSTFP